MVLASPGPFRTPSSSPPKTPFRSYSAITPPRYGNPTLPPQAAAAAASGDGAWEARTGPRQTQTCRDTPATARLCRGRPLKTLQPTKRQPATVDAVERGGRVTTARQTMTSRCVVGRRRRARVLSEALQSPKDRQVLPHPIAGVRGRR